MSIRNAISGRFEKAPAVEKKAPGKGAIMAALGGLVAGALSIPIMSHAGEVMGRIDGENVSIDLGKVAPAGIAYNPHTGLLALMEPAGDGGKFFAVVVHRVGPSWAVVGRDVVEPPENGEMAPSPFPLSHGLGASFPDDVTLGIYGLPGGRAVLAPDMVKVTPAGGGMVVFEYDGGRWDVDGAFNNDIIGPAPSLGEILASRGVH